MRKLARNISMMSVAVFLSRILGLVRDQVLAYCFGTSWLNDAFIVGFKLPNLLRSLFGEGALSASFVPLYNELGVREDRRGQITFALQVLGLLTLFLLALTALGIAFAPVIVKIVYPGLAPRTNGLAVLLTRIMFPYLFWIGLSSTLIAILNSHDRFFMTGLSSGMLNLGMILSMVVPRFVFHLEGVELVKWAAWGVFGGGFLQTVINFPYLRRLGYPLRLVFSFGGEAVRTLWKRLIPSLIGVGIREINLVADSLMASFLAVGSISALEYGNRLFQLPLGIFAISAGTALLPSYSRAMARQDYAELSSNLRFAFSSLAYALLPITILILVLGGDLVQILFQRGAFDAQASLWTRQALSCYSLGLVFFGLNQTLTPLFFARGDTRTPVRIAAWMVGLNILLNFVLMQFLQHRGLALATSLTAGVNFILLWILIRRKLPGLDLSGILANLGKTILACALVFGFLLAAVKVAPRQGTAGMIGVDSLLALLGLTLFWLLGKALRLEYFNLTLRRIWKRQPGK